MFHGDSCIQDGRSPLWLASFYGHQKVVELLIRAGANVNLQNEVSVITIASHTCASGVSSTSTAVSYNYHCTQVFFVFFPLLIPPLNEEVDYL